MSTIYVGCQLQYNVLTPTSFLLNISATMNFHQTVRNERIDVAPFQPLEQCQIGPLGNRLFRLVGQPGPLSISYQAEVDLRADEVDANNVCESKYSSLPPEVLIFLNPSRYCESDKLGRFAMEEFGWLLPGYSRVTAVCNWTFEHLTYTPGSTGPTTTACDVLLQRTGVCRDYAHVAISLCRAMGIPARYVAGYAVNLQPPDFHGFFEAFLDGRWFLFDATRLAPVGGFVRIGTGRDAADVAFATMIGSAESVEMHVWANDSNPQDARLSPDNVGSGLSSA
ncbi:Transglutaminase-like superfamily protein [Rosistilla carotiformis]|uniref:Transglutaminase-like superfamily protein n=1 Tax=Rosistilla carotiformis TaxID=2528017 RepID=A0A518JQB1_9BACT|nr:transglutaminase family protein [Rosistilla carotiformis]QDV67731.1 Transglutaminase-like superfamily protein [Rosistilla carotiformis]